MYEYMLGIVFFSQEAPVTNYSQINIIDAILVNFTWGYVLEGYGHKKSSRGYFQVINKYFQQSR